MNTLTWIFYGLLLGFIALTLLIPRVRRTVFSRRFLVNCPADGSRNTVWVTPRTGGAGREAWRLDSCTRLEPGHVCGKECLDQIEAQA